MVRPAPVKATTDPVRAAKRLMTDDNFFVGVLYQGERDPYEESSEEATCKLDSLESEFQLPGLL